MLLTAISSMAEDALRHLGLLLGASLAYLVAICLYRVYLHPLRHVPGPYFAKVTTLWKWHQVSSFRAVTCLQEAHAKYGSRVRIGPNEVSICDPEEINTLYGHRTEYVKSTFYNGFVPAGANKRSLFTERDPRAHGERRKAVSKTYSMSNLVQLEEYCDSVTVQLISLLDRKQGQIVDLSSIILGYAFDSGSSLSLGTHDLRDCRWTVVGELAFGEAFGLTKSGDDKDGFARELASVQHFSACTGCVPSLAPFINSPLGNRILSFLTGKRVGTTLTMGTSRRLVGKRIEADKAGLTKDRRDMLYDLLLAHNPDGTKFGLNDVVREAFTILNAGADTSATALRACIRYIYEDAATLSKARAEIDAAVEANAIGFPATYGKATKLDYLQACIKEGLRMHPSVGMILPRVVPAGGRTISGHFYPEGVFIGMSAWTVHFDERAFGKDAKTWNPDRWLNETEAERRDHARNLLSFGAGARICIGKNISLLEISKVLVPLIYAYDIEFCNPQQPYKVEESWFTPQIDFFCRIKRRAGTAVDVAEAFQAALRV